MPAPRAPLAALFAIATLAACAAPSKGQRVQEAAYDLNMVTRFGSGQAALDRVAKEEREKFVARHRAWHGQIRIVDIELAGMSFPSSDEADVFLQVGWHPVDGADMRTTVVRQRWKDFKGSWMLVAEERSQGDSGLFGEAAQPPAQGRDPSRGPRGDGLSRTTVIRLAPPQPLAPGPSPSRERGWR